MSRNSSRRTGNFKIQFGIFLESQKHQAENNQCDRCEVLRQTIFLQMLTVQDYFHLFLEMLTVQ